MTKPTTNNPDAKKLAWFIDLLNEGRRPEPAAGDSWKPADPKKLVKKRIDLHKLRVSPDALRAEIGGLMRTMLNLLRGWKGSSEALRQANQIAMQSWSSPQFVVDRSGELRVYRTPRPGAGARAFLLIDALDVLTYLVAHGLDSRLKSCPGCRSPQYRGEPPRRCSLWFDGASNQTYCSTRCRQKAERLRNKEVYKTRQREFMRKKRKAEKQEKPKSKRRRARTSGRDTRRGNAKPGKIEERST